MAFQDVENILFRGEPSYVWLESVSEDDIVQYLGRKPPTEYHPDVIPLICRYPFMGEESVLFVCERFLKLLVYWDKYLYQYKDRTDIIIFIAGFFEATGYVNAVNQLIFQRNFFLKQGMDTAPGEIAALNHAITNLFNKKFNQ